MLNCADTDAYNVITCQLIGLFDFYIIIVECISSCFFLHTGFHSLFGGCAACRCSSKSGCLCFYACRRIRDTGKILVWGNVKNQNKQNLFTNVIMVTSSLIVHKWFQYNVLHFVVNYSERVKICFIRRYKLNTRFQAN